MRSKPNRTRRRILLAVLLLGVVGLAVIGVGGVLAWRTLSLRPYGWFGAADYPALVAQGGWSRYGLPLVLPPGATDVMIYAPASAPSMLPSPDQYVEVRFMLSPAAAATLLTSASLSATTVPYASYDFALSRLHTPDDRDPDTPVPAGFQHIILKNPSGMNVGGVSINPGTGEVVYWIFES